MPDFYLFGGPNGAGKTTSALQILPSLGCETFINADLIATGLSPLNVEAAAWKAGVIMMKELRRLGARGVDFGTESTLRAGGNNIPVETIRRRYEKGLVNLRETYLPRADFFTLLDNSTDRYRVVGRSKGVETEIMLPEIWAEVVHD